VLHDDLVERGRRAHLAADRDQDQIGSFGVVACGAEDDRGPLLHLALVGEGERMLRLLRPLVTLLGLVLLAANAASALALAFVVGAKRLPARRRRALPRRATRHAPRYR